MFTKRVGSVSAAALLAGGAVAVSLVGFSGSGGRPQAPQPGRAPTAELVAYSSCDQFLDSVKAEALKQVGPYGLPGPVNRYGGPGLFQSTGRAGIDAAAAPALGAAVNGAAAPYSTTNDQEAGVDEPDTVKTNGRILAVLRQYPPGLDITDVAGLVPHHESSLPLPLAGYPSGMLLTGTYAVVISQPGPEVSRQEPGTGATPPVPAPPVARTPVTRATVISVADPAHPVVLRSFDMSGSAAGVRLIAGRVVVVLQGGPRLAFSYPTDGSAAAQSAATERNRAVIEASTLADWLPTVTSNPSGVTTTAGCAQVLHSETDPGVGTVSVETIDPGLDQPGPETTVMGEAQTVYASPDSLYVATSRPSYPPPGVFLPAAGSPPPEAIRTGGVLQGSDGPTDIAGFDLSDPLHVRYLGSGQVPGQLIGQYAMSAFHGDLRVATTVGRAAPPPGEGTAPPTVSDSRITVLAPQDGALVPVGSVTGLGQGERIYGVRFVGPLAYVVTFRQTDPLYIVDLSDPVHPALRGQLALTGFSSFLQPLDGSLLLGVGQGVNADLRQTGIQLSVFDVADPQAPTLRSRVDLGPSYSPAQHDPHALLWWPDRRLVAMPLTNWKPNSPAMAVWHVGTDGSLEQVASLMEPGASVGGGPSPYLGMPQRAVVAGPLLYTLFPGGIMATNMTTWAQAAWIPFS